MGIWGLKDNTHAFERAYIRNTIYKVHNIQEPWLLRTASWPEGLWDAFQSVQFRYDPFFS